MKQFNNSITQIPNIGESFKWGQVKKAEDHHLAKEIQISFHFEIDVNSLQTRVDNGEIFTLDKLNQEFSADQTQVNNLISWLNSNGYKSVYQSGDKCNVYATSTVDNISKTLNCNFVAVSNSKNEEVSASTSPYLPSDILGVHSINGLQPFISREKKSTKSDTIRYHKKDLSKDAVSYGLPYKVNSILKAYGGDTLTYNGLNQTIGILIDSFPNNSDLVKFWTACGVNTNISRINKINTRNVVIPAPSGEETLDAEWTSGIAPFATINIYATGNLYFTSLDIAIDRMITDAGRDPKFRQASISLGLGEKQMSVGEMNTENTKYLMLRSLGVNIFVSSGDNGSRPNNQVQVEFPASNPNVIAVGGTSLNLNTSNGSLVSETAWSGSGGGTSSYYAKPTWQSSLVSNGRNVPDVAATANPTYGVYVVLANYVYQFGGTSLSAPIWAGICALINDARVRIGKNRIGFLPPLIYPYVGQNKFRDITSGNNGDFTAAAGYDKVTGLGTPNIANLISALVAL
jgi:kumamolisin